MGFGLDVHGYTHFVLSFIRFRIEHQKGGPTHRTAFSVGYTMNYPLETKLRIRVNKNNLDSQSGIYTTPPFPT